MGAKPVRGRDGGRRSAAAPTVVAAAAKRLRVGEIEEGKEGERREIKSIRRGAGGARSGGRWWQRRWSEEGEDLLLFSFIFIFIIFIIRIRVNEVEEE